VVFVQCAGSRDENHLPYCSAVCCAASLKQATYIRSLYPEAKVTIFYIDIRTPGRLEDFYTQVAADEKIELVKGKAAKIDQDGATGDLLVTAEDVLSGRKMTVRAELVVLATGIVPQHGRSAAGLPPRRVSLCGESAKPGRVVRRRLRPPARGGLGHRAGGDRGGLAGLPMRCQERRPCLRRSEFTFAAVAGSARRSMWRRSPKSPAASSKPRPSRPIRTCAAPKAWR
jgi:hypothetical protein